MTDSFRRAVGNEPKVEQMIAESKDIDNYTCTIYEYDNGLYNVIVSERYGGLGRIDEYSPWYDQKTHDYIGSFVNNPRAKHGAILSHVTRAQNISAGFLHKCGAFLLKHQKELESKYGNKRSYDNNYGNIANYNVVVNEYPDSWGVLFLENKSNYYFDNSHNEMYMVGKKDCAVQSRLQTEREQVVDSDGNTAQDQ